MIDHKLKELIPSEFLQGNTELIDNLTSLLEIIDKSNNDEEPCDDSVDDCGDILSPCCESALDLVFGTLPLEVKCLSCSKVYLLKDLATKK